MAKAKVHEEENFTLETEADVIETDVDAVEATAEAGDEEAETPAEDLAITQEDVRLVEAMLFASANAISIPQIAERFPENRVALIPDILEILKSQYESRGVNLVQREGRWALRTATDLGDSLRLEKEQPKKFTRAAMETMAVVAYHQPVTRAEIENIRGVATSPGALDALMEAGWIKPGKRREVPGRPVTWLTSQAFLDHFGLEKLEDLPGMEELKAAGMLDKRPAIEAMPGPDLFDGEGENKGDELAQDVSDEDLIGKSDEDAPEAAASKSSDNEEDFEGDEEGLDEEASADDEESDDEDEDESEESSADDEDDGFDDEDEDAEEASDEEDEDEDGDEDDAEDEDEEK